MLVLPKLLQDIDIGCHTYADDTQFWVSYNESGDFNNEATARRRIKQAFRLINLFMNMDIGYLWLIIDSGLSFHSHVSDLGKSHFFHL